jgi:predicted RNA-binding protein with PUA-like domain
MGLTRRAMMTLMVHSTGLALAVASRSVYAAAAPDSDDSQRLRSFMHDPDSARAIGRWYRREVPDERDMDTLTALILSSLRLNSAQIAPDELTSRLSARVCADFASGSTVRLDGWILSRTEARVCALWR